MDELLKCLLPHAIHIVLDDITPNPGKDLDPVMAIIIFSRITLMLSQHLVIFRKTGAIFLKAVTTLLSIG